MIQRTATDPSCFADRTVFTASARVAWRLVLDRLSFPSGASALLPAYIGITDREGSGIIDPIEATRTPFTLYPLGDRLQVDPNVLEDRLRSGRHPLLLLVHYFGLAHVDVPSLRALCDRYGTLLIEDCAHVPGPIPGRTGLGSFGHAAFFSLHKCFAVPAGGALRANDPDFPLSAPAGADACPQPCVEQFARTDHAAAAARRGANHRWLTGRLAHVDGLTVLYPSIGDQVPHDFPIQVHDGLREKLYFALMEQGLPTIALYYRLIDAITPVDFPASHALSKGILNLPVHQDTTEEDLVRLCDALEATLKRLRA